MHSDLQKFFKAVDDLRRLNLDRQVSFDTLDQKRHISGVAWAMQNKMVSVGCHHQAGKTSYILDNATAHDLIITEHRHEANCYIKHGLNAISFQELFNPSFYLGRRFYFPFIFIDECYRLPDQLLQDLVQRNPHTIQFVQLFTAR